MIERYVLPQMEEIWKEETKYKCWAMVEKVAIETLVSTNIINNKKGNCLVSAIQSDIDYVLPAMIMAKEKEKETKHDLAAFVDSLIEIHSDNDESRWIHYGLTSSDVVDTALSLQMVMGLEHINERLLFLENLLLNMAQKYKHTPIMGRTHGMHAEPTTFGLILLNYYEEFKRHHVRLNLSTENIKVGKLSGAVGTMSHLEYNFDKMALSKLGLKPAPTSNQILQRDRHAEVINTLALIGSSLEKLAVQIRHMQRTEIGEVRESFTKGQKGSSAMPHKTNPILSENICGLARVLRGYAQSSMEDVALWGERDISHSSAERIIIPDSFCLIHFMLDRMGRIMENLVVDENKMQKNIDTNNNLWSSQNIMLKLISRGSKRQQAYAWVQRNAIEALSINDKTFILLIKRDKDIATYLTEKEIDNCCSFEQHFKNIDLIFLDVIGKIDNKI